MNHETEKGRVPPPIPLAIVVCDAIWRDPATGKRFMLGCFSVVHARAFPVTHPLMSVYVAITNGRGIVPFRMRLVDVDEEGEVLWSAEGDVEFPDPRAIVEMDFAMVGVTFPAAGEYRIQFYAADELVMERRILVLQLPEASS